MNRASFKALGISNGLLQVSNIRYHNFPSEFQLRWLGFFLLGGGDDEQCKDRGLGDPGRYFFFFYSKVPRTMSTFPKSVFFLSSYTFIIYLSSNFFSESPL